MTLPITLRDIQSLQKEIASGTVCPCCLTAECDQVLEDRQIRINDKMAWLAHDCCEREARRLQEHEDRTRAGIRTDILVELHRMSGIPEKFRDVTFSDYELTLGNGAACKAAHAFAMEGKSALIIGPRGTGKTMLGCAALNRIINDKAIEARYIYTPDLFGLLRERIQDAELSAITAGEVCRLPYIVLDDPGVDKDSEWTASIYMRILDARYREKRPTFIASNEGMSKLEQILGARSMSRICETFTIAELKGPDRRMK